MSQTSCPALFECSRTGRVNHKQIPYQYHTTNKKQPENRWQVSGLLLMVRSCSLVGDAGRRLLSVSLAAKTEVDNGRLCR